METQFGFWKQLQKKAREEGRPILTLAPMADVTDAAFRRIIAKYGKPDVTWTEFVSADGLCSAGRPVLLRDLAYDESERPIVAQLFTSHPEKMFEAAQLVASLGFDGIDINMGCPDKSIEKQGAGAANIKNPARAVEVIEAARRGAPNLPVSVKTRIGYNTIDLEGWIGTLLKLRLPVLTVHLRTRKEMSDVPAQWNIMKTIVAMRDAISPETILLGNGDVLSRADAEAKTKESGADGAMLGRAIFGNPWLFNPTVSRETITIPERLRVMVEHTRLFGELLGDIKSFAIMKKHYKAYVHGWVGSKEFRMQLMEATSIEEVAERTEAYIKANPNLTYSD